MGRGTHRGGRRKAKTRCWQLLRNRSTRKGVSYLRPVCRILDFKKSLAFKLRGDETEQAVTIKGEEMPGTST